MAVLSYGFLSVILSLILFCVPDIGVVIGFRVLLNNIIYPYVLYFDVVLLNARVTMYVCYNFKHEYMETNGI